MTPQERDDYLKAEVNDGYQEWLLDHYRLFTNMLVSEEFQDLAVCYIVSAGGAEVRGTIGANNNNVGTVREARSVRSPVNTPAQFLPFFP